MNESRGAKGGYNDRRRSLKISKSFKDKLVKYEKDLKKKELKELEKKVQKQQIITFFKILPIVALGNIYQTLTAKPKEEKEIENLKEIKEIINKSDLYDEKISKQVTEVIDNKIELLELRKENHIKEETDDKLVIQISETEILELNPLYTTEIKTFEAKDYQNQNKKTNELITDSKNEIIEEKIEKLKTKRLVTEYENTLKDARKDLRELTFEYNTIENSSEEVTDSKEADELLEKLNSLIKKIEELKAKIDIEDYDKYDKNYLYVLIEDYLNDFKNQKDLGQIKDSSLYILLSNKINELENKKDNLKENLTTKKEVLQIDEAKLNELKSKYYDFERFNNELIKFQNEQDLIVQEINRKIATATTVEEKVQFQVQGMQRQNRRLRNMLAASLMLPGARSAKMAATTAVTSLYFMRKIMNPKLTKKKYKVINVADYSKDIENSLSQIEDISSLLSKTTSQIDKMINQIEKEFADYFATIPECRKLISDLESVKSSIAEKEYEMQKLKEQQQLNLSKNNAKVKRLV